MEELNCPICEEIVYSSIGNGCKLCGMPLDKGEEFCSDECRIKYTLINMNLFKKGSQNQNFTKNLLERFPN